MSADNWTDCPRCKNRAEGEISKRETEAERAYGKVSAEEYQHLLALATQGPDFKRDTFREDYELGVNLDGRFYVSYAGRCTVCGLIHTFKHEEPVSL